jgi:hypothetical protein
MSVINEPSKLVWRTKSTGGGKEGRHLVTEGGIVRMLHDGHQLQCRVPKTVHVR